MPQHSLSLKWIVFHTGIAGVGGRVHRAADFIIQVGGKINILHQADFWLLSNKNLIKWLFF
jgi:hypothetical protein